MTEKRWVGREQETVRGRGLLTQDPFQTRKPKVKHQSRDSPKGREWQSDNEDMTRTPPTSRNTRVFVVCIRRI